MSQATEGIPAGWDLDVELISMGPGSEASAKPKAADPHFDDLMESLSRTLRQEQITQALAQARAAAEAPPPSPFEYEWHPVRGCRQRVSRACEKCPSALSKGLPVFDAEALMEPIKRRKPMDILVAPHSDLFQSDIDDQQRNRIFAVMKNAPQHRFFVLTKNPAYMRRYLRDRADFQQPLPNVWLGVSVEDQTAYDQRVYELMLTPASNRWIAFEPLLGPINTATVQLPTFDRYHPWRGIVQAYEYMDDQGRRYWAPDDAPPLQQLPIPRWIYIAGQRGEGALPPHPGWVKKILGAAEGISAWFGGFGEFGVTEQPDLARDKTLVYMSQTGEIRGMGAGSKTNYLSQEFEGEKSAIFSRTLAPRARALLDGSTLMQKAPVAVALRSGIRATPFNLSTRTSATQGGSAITSQVLRGKGG